MRGWLLLRRVPFGPGGQQAVQVYLPASYAPDRGPRFPVLYLLHGSGADETQWPAVGIACEADRLVQLGLIRPFVIVMPDEGVGSADLFRPARQRLERRRPRQPPARPRL